MSIPNSKNSHRTPIVIEKQKATIAEENRRQLEAKALVSVEDIDQRKADSGADKAVYGMEHRVPEGEAR